MKIDYSVVITDYLAGKNLTYISNYGISYVEELESVLNFVIPTDRVVLQKLSALPTIDSCDNEFTKLMYKCSLVKSDKEISDLFYNMFYENDSEYSPFMMSSWIKKRPVIYPSIPKVCYVYLASLIDMYCDKFNLTAPRWLNNEYFCYEIPKIVDNKYSIEDLLAKCYYVFSKRNLYLSGIRYKGGE